MAKPARPGAVKTRLIPEYGAAAAARIHQAMLDCVLNRVAGLLSGFRPPIRQVLALTEPYESDIAAGSWTLMGQGPGDLGDRLVHVHRACGGGRVLFLGADSPDVPAGHLLSALRGLAESGSVVGPAEDGGYWTIGAGETLKELVRGIDWGTSSVYHQTLQRAAQGGINLLTVARWFDVDAPADVVALQRRLAIPEDHHLNQLRDRLAEIVKDGRT